MLASKAKLTTLAVRLLGVVIGALLIVLVVVPLLGPCWHLLYGDAISFQGWTLPVPKGFYVRKSRNGPVMWKQTFGVPFFNASYGHISFFLRPPKQPFSFERDYIQFKNGLAQDANEKGYKLTSERTVSVGKEPAYCLEFRRSSPEPGSLLRCAVESSAIVIFYEGDPRYVRDVFATLQRMSADSGRGTVYLYDEENINRLCLRRRLDACLFEDTFAL
jgi:hypothetical protein